MITNRGPLSLEPFTPQLQHCKVVWIAVRAQQIFQIPQSDTFI